MAKDSQMHGEVADSIESKDRHSSVATTKAALSPITQYSASSNKSTKATEPHSILETLAYSNYASPRPCPIDPAVFFDLVKVRRLVEEATDLAVRAANGTTSSSLRNSLQAGNSVYNGGGGGAAAALGLGFGGASHTKLSKERKHRMRDLATQKLSRAYHLDEIAASVATMQSASSLDEVAKLVLQRNANDSDAKYVHFFHEKIPSRMLNESTNLESLDEIVRSRPTDAAPLRTRAVTKIFKHDLVGAAEDLTEALAISRYTAMQHRAARGLTEISRALVPTDQMTETLADWRHSSKIAEEDQPSSLEPQLLFQRAAIYLSLACENIASSLDHLESQDRSCRDPDLSHSEVHPHKPSSSTQAQWPGLASQRLVKSYAKRALRDYISFLSFFDYTAGSSTDVAQEPMRKSKMEATGLSQPALGYPSHFALSDALIPHPQKITNQPSGRGQSERYPQLPPLKVLPVSDLFSSSSPTDLPPYPVTGGQIVKVGLGQPHTQLNGGTKSMSSSPEGHEAITYHPLLIEALHALLLCHCLVQTSSKEHLRHAYMVARLARLCDGYPIFLAARSPSRADWVDVTRQADNWIGLQQSWESLCAPAALPSSSSHFQGHQHHEEAEGHRWQEAVMDSLADERVQDQATFEAAVAARAKRAKDVEKGPVQFTEAGSKQWAQADSKEYPITTERAEAIARWVKEAPSSIPGPGRSKGGKRKGKASKKVWVNSMHSAKPSEELQ
ncbi:MAG: hypothetical protein Q9181_000266 [Wetmoreana brouardii]